MNIKKKAMKTPYYKIKIYKNQFSISLNKKYAKYIYSFATHLEFALQLYSADVSFVSRDTMTIRGTFNDVFTSVERAIIEQIQYYFSNK